MRRGSVFSRGAVRVLAAATVMCSMVTTGGAAHAATKTAVVDATCTLYGDMQFNPGITATDQPQTITLSSARVGSDDGTRCPGAPGHFGAVVLATFDAPSVYCANTTSDTDTLAMSAPATARVKLRWPDGDRSVWKAHVSLSSASSQTFVWSGAVSSGDYAGDRAKARTRFASTTNGHCSEGTPITSMSFGAGSHDPPGRLLTFSHNA